MAYAGQWIWLWTNRNALLQVAIFLLQYSWLVRCAIEISSWLVDSTVYKKMMWSLMLHNFQGKCMVF